jgi:integrase
MAQVGGHRAVRVGATGRNFQLTGTSYHWLDEEGVSGRQVANQLGHAKPSMTMDHYMSRRAVTERVALVL